MNEFIDKIEKEYAEKIEINTIICNNNIDSKEIEKLMEKLKELKE
jgi:hypothetical protein